MHAPLTSLGLSWAVGVSDSFFIVSYFLAKFLNLVHHAAQGPKKKYSETQTEAQEIGWDPHPLVSMAPSQNGTWEHNSNDNGSQEDRGGSFTWV